jgi:hypothetical protein
MGKDMEGSNGSLILVTAPSIARRTGPQRDAVKAEVLKPFLNIGLDCVVRWKSPASEMFFQFAKHVKAEWGLCGGWMGGVGLQKWLHVQNVSLYRKDLQNLTVHYGKCLNKFGDYGR